MTSLHPNNTNLVWIDLEFTTLNWNESKILEIACLITDKDLNVINKGIDLIIHNEPDILSTFEPIALEMHRSNGLLDKVLNTGISLEESQEIIVKEILNYCVPGTSPLCGSTNWIDRVLIVKNYPKIHKILHYRHIDVSAVKVLANKWYKDMPNFTSSKDHTAIGDIKKSIDELKYYRNNIFVPSTLLK